MRKRPLWGKRHYVHVGGMLSSMVQGAHAYPPFLTRPGEEGYMIRIWYGFSGDLTHLSLHSCWCFFIFFKKKKQGKKCYWPAILNTFFFFVNVSSAAALSVHYRDVPYSQAGIGQPPGMLFKGIGHFNVSL